MEIREATAADWPRIWSVMEPVVRAGETYTWDTDTDERTLRVKWLHERLPGRTVVAMLDGEVVGTAETHPNYGGGAADVANAGFMVDGGHAGKGIARALAEHVLAAARADGYRAVVFNAVVSSNERAVGLWQSLGFSIVGTVPGAFRRPDGSYVGLHVMHRWL
ncbi:GNAT family N-acetyltransferase [Georgenia yuyongxinii]|uniref:GNAT family N-acetyltransferase n=1 Tax=Georgenia yuyongxinii TaxID=2589797 RepID=A0A5B8C7C6_9MICO|nr:GNAT family N-acetyltransferase [Georgenia yuyongxinii]QDC26354.1 GNAT family N-acetyltransferase [Georgenia yuyongxinii]